MWYQRPLNVVIFEENQSKRRTKGKGKARLRKVMRKKPSSDDCLSVAIVYIYYSTYQKTGKIQTIVSIQLEIDLFSGLIDHLRDNGMMLL